MADSQPSLTHRVAKGASWMVLMRFSIRSIGIVSTLILARLLVPEDFGVVAIATLILGVVEIIGQFGFETAIIRDMKAERPDYDTAWTMKILRGVVVGSILAGSGPFVAAFFGDPRVENVMYVLAAASFLDSVQNIGVVDFRKNIQMHREFNFRVWRKVVSFVVTIVLAFVMKSYWALVFGIFADRATGLVASYMMSKYRPRLTLVRWRKLLGFSVWVLVHNVLWYARENVGRAIIGRILDSASLGVYSVAKELAQLPTSELVLPIQAALVPGYARIVNNPSALASAYVRTFSTVLMIAAPAGIGLALLAEPFVLTVLGASWESAVPVLQILAFHGTMQVSYASAGGVLLSLGKPRILVYLSLSALTYGIPMMIFGTQWYGLEGAAWAMVVMTAINGPITAFIVSKTIKVRYGTLAVSIWRTIVSLAAMSGVVLLLLRYWPDLPVLNHPVVQLLAGAAAGAITYVVIHLGLWWLCGRPRSAEAEVLRLAGHYLPARFRLAE
ncbi:MAG: hypothetical protein CMM50_04275 [Rhodospirillaceae bacterium]|nr:hypothetical protein [Rhodospirillaceae bacterium]